MQLTDMISQVEAMVVDVTKGDIASAWQDSIPVQQAMIDLWKSKQAPVMQATPENEANGKKLMACCKKLEVACEAREKEVHGNEAGKLFPGDGSFLKNFAVFIQTILPLIMPFIPHAA